MSMPTKTVFTLGEEIDVADEGQTEDEDVAIEQPCSMQGMQPNRESRVRLKWEDRLAQLRTFRARHGHVDVPRSYTKDPSLGTFVCNQRQTYKRMNEGKGPIMDRLRVQQLNELGFKWVLKHRDQPVVVDSDDDMSDMQNVAAPATLQGPKPKPLSWEIGIQQIREFKVVNGHTDVPHIYAPNQPLGNFVKSIRQSYKNTQKGQTNKLLNDERISELQRMGFKLQVRHREPWEQRFQELKSHYQKHGNCEIPKNTPLGIWILNQRSQFKLMLARQKTSLSGRRIALLNSIGFDWRVMMQHRLPGQQIVLHEAFLPRRDGPEFGIRIASNGVSTSPVAFTDDSCDEDSLSPISTSDMPPLCQSRIVETYDNPSMTNFICSAAQRKAEFDCKPSPNARRVSEDSNKGSDDSNENSVSQLNNHQSQNNVSTLLESVSDFDSSQVDTGFGLGDSNPAAQAPCNADSFVDSLLNSDFSGYDFSGHNFSRYPIVTEDDEGQVKGVLEV